MHIYALLMIKIASEEKLRLVACGMKDTIHLILTLPGTNKVNELKEKSREYQNYKSQPIPDTKRKRNKTQTNTSKTNKDTKSIQISSLFHERGDRNAKRAENLARQG